MSSLHFVVPDAVADAQRPTGGNSYDRELLDALTGVGRRVLLHPIPDCFPLPGPALSEQLADCLGGLPPDSVVLIDGLLAFAAPRACAAAARTLRLSVLAHGLPGEDTDSRDIDHLLAAAHAVITTSGWTRDRLVTQHHLPATAVHVAPPGVRPAPATVASPAGDRLLCVANVAWHKGQDLLVQALALLPHRQWQCDFVGALDWQLAYTRAVQAGVAEADLTARVRFHGVLTGSRLADAYAAADLVVVPSRVESYGMVITEALARGVPVVATNVGGIPEAMGEVGGQRPGMLVAPDSPHELGRALDAWLTDPNLRRELRVAAVARRPSLQRWTETARTVAQASSSPAPARH